MNEERKIAYFSMEIALEESIPTYAGGLGILAGDTIRAAADMAIPMIAVSLIHRQGYFFQRLDDTGWQTEDTVSWVPDDYLKELEPRVEVTIDGRTVNLRAWQYTVCGCVTDGTEVPVILLDADLPENAEWDRRLTDKLYGGDGYYRLCQEIILGIGGVRMLRALLHKEIDRYHMNEGHAALLAFELLEETKQAAGREAIIREDIDHVRHCCIFTTHTPVAAGHDKFPMDLAKRVIGLPPDFLEHTDLLCCGDELNMTYLALNLSHYVNGVARRHGEISQHMFAGYKIDAITNGVHAGTWVSAPFQSLFDRHIAGWRQDSYSLRSVLSVPGSEVWQAHRRSKHELLDFVNRQTNSGFDLDHLTFGFARRAAPYKRSSLPVSDLERLKKISTEVGPIQFVFAGKAHPGDNTGKDIIKRIFQARNALGDTVRVAYLPNYDMKLAKLLVSGVDIWLNTPQPPMEASGTSGMKAALNGVPSLSILDGWWLEGCIEGVTGWAIDGDQAPQEGRERWESDAESFYEKLETIVVPMFYNRREDFENIMKHSIALNGSFFNTQRMLQQYVVKAYFPG
jgi:starch phosphorylase